MPTINVANLVFTMQQKISSTTNEQDLFYYSKVLQQLRSGKVYVVNAITDLPTAAANVGELYYVVLNTTLYVSNAVRGWSALGTTPLNQIWNWGYNVQGQLGDNTTTSRCIPAREITSSTTWCQTSAKGWHISALKTDGTLWSWGYNCGRLGDNTVASRSSPVREISSSTNWCQTSAGKSHTSAVKTDGSLWSWGSNSCGALGDNTIANRSSPVREITSSTNWFETSAGNQRANALKTDGSLWVWGYGRCGRLGDNGTLDRSSPVREITSSTTWCQTSIGGFATMSAVKTDGTLWSWGSNSCGVLGDGTVIDRSSPVREATFSTAWCQTSAGDAHTSALKTDGTLWSWGYNGGGRLGDGTVVSRCFPVREITSSNTWCQTSAGVNFTSALKIYSTLWSWGSNSCGQLGDTTVTSRSSPVREITSSNTWWQTSAGAGFTSALK